MSTGSDPDLWAKIAGGFGAALSALGTWAWGHTHKRIDKVESALISKDEFDAHIKADEKIQSTIAAELTTQRGHIGKIYDQMRDMEDKGHSRHVELLNAIHEKK